MSSAFYYFYKLMHKNYEHNIKQTLFETAKQFVLGGINLPFRAFKSVGGDPIFIERGAGSKFYDAKGNEL